MVFYYVNNIDRSADVQAKSLGISDEIQQRANSCSFLIFRNSEPSENEPLRIFRGDTIASAAGAVITLDGKFELDKNMFFPGQRLQIRINDADEETVIVQSYVESTLTLTLEAAPSGVVSSGDKIGQIIFGGVLSRVKNMNVFTLDKLNYSITGVDHNKEFDRKLVADTWVDRDSRYIINDFLNSTVNYNHLVDDFEYANDAAIQAVWIETGDGDNPTMDTVDPKEGDSSGSFNWTNSGGTATFTATFASSSVTDWTVAALGTPTAGVKGFWMDWDDYTKITGDLMIRIGSGPSDYAEYTIDQPTQNSNFIAVDLDNPDSITGTPDWNAFAYVQLIIPQNASGSVIVDGMRFLLTNYFKHFPHVDTTPVFDDLRSPQLKATALMQLLAKTWSYVWYIDYEKFVHFKDSEAEPAPFQLTDDSDNFFDLNIQVDQSQLGNQIIVRGGEKISDGFYSQAVPGDGVRREWLMKTKFSEMSLLIDDQSDTHAAEAGTNTTNIKVTGHGLASGAYITNQNRTETRIITFVDVDNFTVDAISGQTTGDTITFFTISKTIGIEGLDDETAFDYVGNSNEKSVRDTDSEATLVPGDGILFTYKEKIPIQLQYSDPSSVSAMKALGFGDGIFDLDPFTDRNIEDVSTALAIAQSQTSQYSNPLILGSFLTHQHGLAAGQIIGIQDSMRGIDTEYVIQKVRASQVSGGHNDYFEYRVTFGTTLFGIIEFFQKLLSTQDKIELNVDDIVETYVSSDEVVESSEASQVATDGGFLSAKSAETVESSDVNQAVIHDANDWKFEPSIGQPLESRFNLASFG